jgi:hypothetical protein
VGKAFYQPTFFSEISCSFCSSRQGHDISIIFSLTLGWRIPYLGSRNPSESVRIRSSTESGIHFDRVNMPIQTAECGNKSPCGAARNPPESTRIRPSTESVQIRKRHLRCNFTPSVPETTAGMALPCLEDTLTGLSLKLLELSHCHTSNMIKVC